MKDYSRSNRSDQTLRQQLTQRLAHGRANEAEWLADLAEYDARKLYLPDGYSSMCDYCVRGLRLDKQAAIRRIGAARAAREYPVLFDALASGRLHLTAVVLLKPHLTPGNVEELVIEAVHKTGDQIEQLLAERFPRSEAFPMVVAVTPGLPSPPGLTAEVSRKLVSPAIPVPAERRIPIAPQRFELRFVVDQPTHESLTRVQELLSHQVPSGDLAEVFSRAIRLLETHLEKRKFAPTSRPRPSRPASTNPRYVPAEVRRAVRERDGDRCTFVSDSGRRCESRHQLEFDHIVEVARGGNSTVSNLRLRCRAHNQYEAERTFGIPFMEAKRRRSRSPGSRGPLLDETTQDVVRGLRTLGYTAEKARWAATHSGGADAPLESRLRTALAMLCPRARRIAPREGRA